MFLFKTCLFITRGNMYDKSEKVIAPTWNDEFKLPDGFRYPV